MIESLSIDKLKVLYQVLSKILEYENVVFSINNTKSMFLEYCSIKKIKPDLEIVNKLINTKMVKIKKNDFQIVDTFLSGLYVGEGKKFGDKSFGIKEINKVLEKYHNKNITLVVLEDQGR